MEEGTKKRIEAIIGVFSLIGFILATFSFSGITGRTILGDVVSEVEEHPELLGTIFVVKGVVFGLVWLWLKKHHKKVKV